jgi:hypothetical protein
VITTKNDDETIHNFCDYHIKVSDRLSTQNLCDSQTKKYKIVLLM